jgi:DNA-directed RNA polymerase subunit M/transcription elongation factor TFIIS
LKTASSNKVSFVCNCGDEITVEVKPDEENDVVCPKCGQEYRFFGQSVLRFRDSSDNAEH